MSIVPSGLSGRYISLEDILDGLTCCICCDEPDGDKYRSETRYWLAQLVEYLKGEK